MQRGLAGSEQGTASKRNSAGTCQPLSTGGDWPRAQQNKLGTGNPASTMGTEKILRMGMQASREDEGSLGLLGAGACPAHNAELDGVQQPTPQLRAHCQGGTDTAQGRLQKSYGHDENKEG